MSRFEFRYDRLGFLSTMLGMGRGKAFIDVTDGRLLVRMGWAFSMEAPLDVVAWADRLNEGIVARAASGVGVHGGRGRWRVNGATTPMVRVHFRATQRARVLGIPVRIDTLEVNPTDPETFIAEVHPAG